MEATFAHLCDLSIIAKNVMIVHGAVQDAMRMVGACLIMIQTLSLRDTCP
jgi:hypothetical protein